MFETNTSDTLFGSNFRLSVVIQGGYYETGMSALVRVLGFFLQRRGIPPPARPEKGVTVPEGTRHYKEGVPPKNQNAQLRLIQCESA